MPVVFIHPATENADGGSIGTPSQYLRLIASTEIGMMAGLDWLAGISLGGDLLRHVQRLKWTKPHDPYHAA